MIKRQIECDALRGERPGDLLTVVFIDPKNLYPAVTRDKS